MRRAHKGILALRARITELEQLLKEIKYVRERITKLERILEEIKYE